MSYVAIALNNYAHAEESKNKALQLSKEIEKRKQAQDNLQKANSKLEALLTKDVLTDIPNRRSFENFASMQWKQSLVGPTPIAFLMIDIDCFKQYNDTYGHVAGDQSLHRVAQALMQSTRDLNDFIARYGGEEFVVVLPRVRYKEAMQTAERLRRSVEELQLEHKSSSASGFLTISVGVVACVPRSPSGLKKAIALADKALYQSKKLGRNRITGTDLSSQDKEKQ
ncbi:MAG: GGDEF domain-containing protein [Clostridia bacterium]